MTTKITKKAASKKSTKAAPKNKVSANIAASYTTPVADPCATGHTWETDAEGVEHCNVCLADRKVIE